MRITLIAEPGLFEAAVADAEKIGKPEQLTGLRAPLQGVTLGRLKEAWDTILDSIRKGIEFGVEKVDALVETTWESISAMITSAGNSASELKDYLIERLRQFLATFVDGMLKQVRTEITIGDSIFRLNLLQINQKVVIGGSLKASIKEIITLISNGEIEIEASYSVIGAG